MKTLKLPADKTFADYQREFEVALFNVDRSISDWIIPNVRVAPIPEPATIALTSGALLASSLVLRHRRRAVKP